MVGRSATKTDRVEHEIEFSRIVAFSDGVFAIAITLLVLQLEVPHGVTSSGQLWHDIFHQNGDLYAFAISFAVIGRFTSAAVIIYAGNLAALTLVGALMTTYAVRAGLTADGRSEEIRANRSGGLWACAVFLASIPVAAINPLIAPFMWLLFFDPSERIARRIGVVR